MTSFAKDNVKDNLVQAGFARGTCAGANPAISELYDTLISLSTHSTSWGILR